jgi:hypothetical protein
MNCLSPYIGNVIFGVLAKAMGSYYGCKQISGGLIFQKMLLYIRDWGNKDKLT